MAIARSTSRTEVCSRPSHIDANRGVTAPLGKGIDMAQRPTYTRACPRCERAMVHITLDIESEKRTLHSCSHCDVRQWEAPSGQVDLEGVLNELADSAGS